MRRILGVCLAAGVLGLVVGPAFGPTAAGQDRFVRRALPYPASADFVCQVFLLPPGDSPASGSFGSIRVVFFTQPDCKGDRVGDGQVFSQGATDPNASPTYLVSESMLHTYFLMLQRAAGTGQKVAWIRCDDTRTSCIRALAANGVDAALR